MLSIPTPFTGTSLDLALPGVGWVTPLRWALLILVPLVLVILLTRLYRNELRLVARRTALALLCLRLALVGIVLFLLLLDPTVSLVTKESVPGRVLVAVDVSESMRVPDPHRPLREKLALAKVLKLCPDLASTKQLDRWIQAATQGTAATFDTADEREAIAAVLRRLDAITRLTVAERILTPVGADVLARLRDKHAVRLVKFDQTLADLPGEANLLSNVLNAARSPTASANPTDLSLPLRRASEAGDPAQLLGVILLTDGRHNWGDSPLALATELGRHQVPIFPLLVAPEQLPPDVSLVTAQAQSSTVFQGVTVPIEVEVRATDWPAGNIRARLILPPNDIGVRPKSIEEVVKHDGGNATYRLVLRAKLDALGPQMLTIDVEGEGRVDHYPENNRRTVRVNVVKDRARLLLVDGEARWEFHYLHTCLGRDPTMDIRSVVFRQPRVTSAGDEELRKVGIPALRMPTEKEALYNYDCVILGDVEPEQFPLAERERLERYVAEEGGTLVLLAGKRALPMAYSALDGDPIAKLLPIRNPKPTVSNTSGFAVTPTAEGRKCWFLQMGETAIESASIWGGFPPHYWAVTGEAKDAAEVLASTPAGPTIVRQNYGFGRVLYVGIDSTWRWRYKIGDKHHHRFWGQVARWAASDRLLPTSNPAGTIKFGTRETAYQTGQDVEVIVRGTDAVKPLTKTTPYRTRLIQLPDRPDASEKTISVTPLTIPAARNRDLSGTLRDLPPGRYAIELDIPDWNAELQGPPGPDGRALPLRSAFTVLPPEYEELRDLSSNRPLLESIAEASGGKVYTPEDVSELIDRLRQETATVEHRVDRPLRRSWWWLGALVLLLSCDWCLRKWSGLP